MSLECKASKFLFMFTLVLVVICANVLIYKQFMEAPIYKFRLLSKLPRIHRHPTCTSIFQISSSHTKKDDSLMNIAKDVISEAKNQKHSFVNTEVYIYLSSLIPSMIEKNNASDSKNSNHLTFKKIMRFDQMKGRLPYLPCNLKRYNVRDIQSCLRKREAHNIKMKILYVGDSRVRQQMETMLYMIRDLNISIVTSENETITPKQFFGKLGDMKWMKYKNKLNITSPDLPDFCLQYIWAPFLFRHSKNTTKGNGSHKKLPTKTINVTTKASSTKEKLKENSTGEELHAIPVIVDHEGGALDEIQKLSVLPTEELPAIVILGTGAWNLFYNDKLKIALIDEYGIIGLKTLHSAIERLAERTTVVFSLPEPIKEYMVKTTIRYSTKRNYLLEWFLNAQVKLIPKNVQIWDSFLPVAYAAYQDCIQVINSRMKLDDLPAYEGYSAKKSWQCDESAHVGFESIFIAAQMTINFLCNPHMELNNTFCCNQL